LKKEKFISDTETVLKFIQIYCNDKHKDEKKIRENLQLFYLNQDLHVKVDYDLCSTCKDTFLYSYQKLQACPHEEKPRCRKCPNPCYDKQEWKTLAKIMRHSGMKLGILKIKKLFKKI
jgi:hypothetical protein